MFRIFELLSGLDSPQPVVVSLERNKFITDCEYESLLELFRYMYSDEVNLSGSNVMEVLYLAKKYMVPSLADECSEYLQDNLDPSNVFCVLPHAQKFEEEKLLKRCWQVIDEETEEAVKSDGFATIERPLLEAVVERDTWNIEEVELFKAVNLWATKKCREQGLSTDGSLKRRILGEQIVKGIRFPVMKQQEFAAVVLDCKILTQEEVFSVVKYFNSVPDSPLEFTDKNRTGFYHRRCRFGSVEHPGFPGRSYPYVDGRKDCLIFYVDKDISLIGIALLGSENNRYSVHLEIRCVDEREFLCNSTSGKFSSVLIKSESVSYYGFKILFDSPVVIKKGVLYRIKASISGANSCIGQSGKLSVLCSGITFHFESSIAIVRSKRTNARQGQFSEFLFTVT